MDNQKRSPNPAAIDDIAQALDSSFPLREPVIQAAIEALQLPAGTHGLDAGCGVGIQALLLAEAVGPDGRVTGLDLSPETLTRARELAAAAGYSNRITFKEGDVAALPFDDDTFDWAWSMDCVGYMPVEPLPLVRELVRVVRPGGRVAILAWSSEKLLPGHPVLEARLGATTAGLAPFAADRPPDNHFMRALGWLRAAGLTDTAGQTFAGDAHAPLFAAIRRALEDLFLMRWPGVQDELSPDDWADFQRLCRPGSPAFILDRPDYFAFFTYAMFSGKVDE